MENNYITITQLNKYLKYKFDNDSNLTNVYLKGEISNFKAHTRGHYYFTLKDDNSRINAVMFASSVSNCKFMPTDGMKVLVTGKVTVYEQTGGYQIYVTDMLEDGIGNLYIAYEQLKKRLEAEGLFSQKRKIPRMPKKVGIITASTGAAIRDILTTIKRRFPTTETILFPALVQGEYAAEDIAKKIKIANTYDIDTLIIGRGGGSIEDLWPFNEEVVARAIYASHIPTISAVGHEVDFTIADFVADLRAPTPTAAAELAVVDEKTVKEYLNTAKNRTSNAVKKIIDINQIKLNNIKSSYIFKNPNNIYEVKEQKLDILYDKLNTNINKIIESERMHLYKLSNSSSLTNPSILILKEKEIITNLTTKLSKNINELIIDNKTKLFKLENSFILTNPNLIYQKEENKLNNLTGKLILLNPMNSLKRGYAIIKKKNKVVNDKTIYQENDELEIELNTKIIEAKITKVSDKDEQ